MYRNCMFCQKSLGENRAVEHFPIGRRLAFDAERGRLWVVCRSCERWNLTPLEERWEAVEECERLFRGTRVRSQTENIGLAKHPEGLTLVRVGEPLREEFAAWRYGDQFGRRRKKAILVGVGAVTAVGALAAGAVAAGVSAAFLGQAGNFVNLFRNGRTLVKLRTEDGELLKLKRPDLEKARLIETSDEQGWAVRLGRKSGDTVVFEGDEGHRVASQLLPRINSTGGSRKVVRTAVREIEEAGHPEVLLRQVARWKRQGFIGDPAGMIGKLDHPTRLALEMALHEEQERRALQGELWLLEQRWREAEEIAGIADSLLLPEGTEDRLDAVRD